MTQQNGSIDNPIRGTSGNDTMLGTAGDDYYFGADGDDVLTGGDGDDDLEGGAGNDSLSAGSGIDLLSGGPGDDTLDGGTGAAYLSGGDGNDFFIVRDRHTMISRSNQPGDHGIIYADWFKADPGVNWTWAPGVQKLPYWIDALLFTSSSVLSTFSANNVIKYNFASKPPAAFNDEDKNGFIPFTAEEKAQTLKIFDYISSVVNVKFVETTDPDGDYTVVLGNNHQPDSGGYATEVFPGSPSKLLLSDDPRILSPSLDKASVFNETQIHELGHVLGLKHPFSHGDAKGDIGEGPYLPDAEDRESLTMMSYTRDLSDPVPIKYSAYDLAALQYIWGVSSKANVGDTDHVIDPTTFQMIYDGSGSDILDGYDLTQDAVLDLRPGYVSYVGKKSDLFAHPGQITINFGTIIESVLGGSGNDKLIGNEYGNFLAGNAGDDTIIGGGGIDKAYYGGKHSEYSVSIAGETTTIRDLFLVDGRDTLTGVERLIFSDVNVALDVEGTAGQAYRLYQAAFDRKPDLEGLGFWLHAMDEGMGVDNVAGFFLQSPEFQRLYGSNLSNADLVTHLYQNVLHRAPETEGFQFWMKALDGGLAREVALRMFSESPENHAVLVGVLQNGFEYVPFTG
jgi:hypothetical protein